MRQGVLDFPLFPLQLKHSDSKDSNINELLLNTKDILIQHRIPCLIYKKAEVRAHMEITGTFQTSSELEDNGDVVISPALTTTQER